MSADVVDSHGRRFEELDALRVFASMPRDQSYAIVAADGTPLCGRHVPGTVHRTFIDPRWNSNQ